MYEVTKEIKWCMGHRLTHGYPNRCKNLHGHNYKVFVTLKTTLLNEVGMVVDFGDIKRLVEKWIMNNWDHATLVDPTDTNLLFFLEVEKQAHFLIEDDCNTTAEWMSKFLFHKVRDLLREAGINNVDVSKIKVYETDSSYATYTESTICSCGDK